MIPVGRDIVHIVEACTGGVLTYLEAVLPGLVRAGQPVRLIASCRRDRRAESVIARLRDRSVKVEVLGMDRRPSPAADLRAMRQLRRLLVEARPALVHTHCSKAGALGRLVARSLGIPAAHTPHCFAFLRAPNRQAAAARLSAERFLGRFTDTLIVVSDDEMQAATHYRVVPPRRCVCVRNGLPDRDHSGPTARPVGLGGRRIVAMACRLVDYKGVREFIVAAARSRAVDAAFVLAGEGPLRQAATEWIAADRLGGKCRLVGHLDDVAALYDAADVVVSCARAEGQPYSLLEAMRAARPVVATDVPGHRDLLDGGRCGLLVARSPSQIAAGVDRLLFDDALRMRLAADARRRFELRHRIDRQIRDLLAVYDATLSRRRRRGHELAG